MNLIALRMLFGDRGKFIALVLIVAFSSLIMTQQPAIFVGLMSRTFSFIERLSNVDIWVMDSGVEFLESTKPMRDTDVLRVRGVEGVAWAVPFYQGLISAQMSDGNRVIVNISGVDDSTLIGVPKVVQGNLEDLRRSDAILVDEEIARTRLQIKDPATGELRPLRVNDIIEINDHRAVVVGLTERLRTFTNQPLTFTTYTRALQWIPPTRRVLSYIFVKAKPGVPKDVLIQRIEQATGLRAQTAQQFMDVNLNYWMKNTGIPINFGTSVLMGFLIGAAVSSQTFGSFVRENLKHFAAFKAMGVRNSTLTRMVLLQAFTAAAIGYGIGIGLASVFGYAMRKTILAFSLQPVLLAGTALAVTLIMTLATFLSLRKLYKLDAAQVFRT